jgi:hypothetical protein
MCEIWIKRLADPTKVSQYHVQISTFPHSRRVRCSSFRRLPSEQNPFSNWTVAFLCHPGFGRVVDLFTFISWLSSHHFKQHSRAPDLGLLFFFSRRLLSSPLAPSRSLHPQQGSFGLIHSCQSSLAYISTTYTSPILVQHDHRPFISAPLHSTTRI